MEQLLRLPRVMELTGYKRSSIYSLVKQGEFPCTDLAGARAKAWIASEIAEWCQSRIAASRTPAGVL